MTSEQRLNVIMNHIQEKKEIIEQSVVSDSKKPQTSVISEMHEQCVICVIDLKDKSDFKDFVKAALAVESTVKKLTPKKDSSVPHILTGVGFNTKLWEKNVKELPSGLGHYKAREGKFGGLPHTEHDVVLHVKASSYSLCYEVVEAFVGPLKNKIGKFEDHYGWQYKDGRDLSGFLDGTMNTTGEKKRGYAALNQNGGSYLIHQRWEHNIDYLNSLPLKEQEDIIGRQKSDSTEQPKNEIGKSSHVVRMRDENFNRIPIVRQSMPFGTVSGKKGLLFIAYSNDVAKFDKMLDRMTDSQSDSVMRYSKCVSGNYYYVPSFNELKSL